MDREAGFTQAAHESVFGCSKFFFFHFFFSAKEISQMKFGAQAHFEASMFIETRLHSNGMDTTLYNGVHEHGLRRATAAPQPQHPAGFRQSSSTNHCLATRVAGCPTKTHRKPSPMSCSTSEAEFFPTRQKRVLLSAHLSACDGSLLGWLHNDALCSAPVLLFAGRIVDMGHKPQTRTACSAARSHVGPIATAD
jgi:hypothetical protein